MGLTRRAFLRSAGVGAVAAAGIEVAAALPAGAGGAATSAVGTDTLLRRRTPVERSPNGWVINGRPNDGQAVWTRPVPGTGFDLDLMIGDVELILVHVVRRFHYEIDTLRPGEVVGFRTPGAARALGDARRHELNHASGTAVDIRPGHYPAGSRGGFFPHEQEVLRDILAECEGVVRWGGDFHTPDEAHFQIDLPPADPRIGGLAAKLRSWRDSAGSAAGVLRDPSEGQRRAAANRLMAVQAS